MNLDYILSEIKLKGQQNREAIAAHKSFKAGKRGAHGLNTHKSEVRGICRHIPRKVSDADPYPLPRIKAVGTLLRCTGPKPDGDGYRRDRITGVITHCK